MMVKIMSNSKRIKGKVHFNVSKLAGAVQSGNWLSYRDNLWGLRNFLIRRIVRRRNIPSRAGIIVLRRRIKSVRLWSIAKESSIWPFLK